MNVGASSCTINAMKRLVLWNNVLNNQLIDFRGIYSCISSHTNPLPTDEYGEIGNISCVKGI